VLAPTTIPKKYLSNYIGIMVESLHVDFLLDLDEYLEICIEEMGSREKRRE